MFGSTVAAMVVIVPSNSAAGKRADLDLHLLPDAERRAVGLGDVGQHPHGLDIGDRIRRRRVARLHIESRRRIARRDPAGDRARHHQRRIGAALGNDGVDLGVGLAEHPHRVARRLQIAFGGLLVGGRLLDVVLRHRPRRVEIAQPRQIFAVQLQHARGRDQRRFRLQQIGAVDGEQRLALGDVVADLGKQRDDAALVRREHLDRHVLVEADAADGVFLDREFALLDRLDLDRGELRIRQVDAVLLAGRGILRGGPRRARSRLRRYRPDARSNKRRRQRQGARRRPPLSPGPCHCHAGSHICGEPSISRIQTCRQCRDKAMSVAPRSTVINHSDET